MTITNNKNLKDVSRFTRWVNGLDEKYKTLDPLVRKSKWILITALLFTLFGISFIWFPRGEVQQHKLTTPQAEPLMNTPNQSGLSAFEMPVDSFENQLKQYIDEGISDKK